MKHLWPTNKKGNINIKQPRKLSVKTKLTISLNGKIKTNRVLSSSRQFGGTDNDQSVLLSKKLPSRPIKVYLSFKRLHSLLKAKIATWSHCPCSWWSAREVPLVGKVPSSQWSSLPLLQDFVLRQSDSTSDGILIGMTWVWELGHIEDGAWLSWCRVNGKYPRRHLPSEYRTLSSVASTRTSFVNADFLLASFNGGIRSGKYFRSIRHLGKLVKLGDQM